MTACARNIGVVMEHLNGGSDAPAYFNAIREVA